ncbi:MAG: efflux RND transporter periplasmic adaptor subunit [Candidatus Competibacteraceae bacterium]
MSLPRHWLPLLLTAGLIGGFGYVAVRTGPLAAIRVTLAAPERHDLYPALFGIGTVEARRAYAIGPTAAGRVQQVLVEVGDVVTAGQLLAEMTPVDLDDRITAAQAALARARSSLAAAEAQVREAMSRREVAEPNARRFAVMRGRGFVTQEAADAKQHEANAARAALSTAEANQAAARQDRDRLLAEQSAAMKLRANLRLYSPVAGIVTARDAEPGSTLVAGQSVVRLIDPGSCWVRLRIDQARSAGLRVGLPVEIVLRSHPGEPLPGQVARVEWIGDSVTEETIAQVAFDHLPDALTLGELAEATVYLPAIAKALTLPSAALHRLAGREGVWVLGDDGVVQFQPIRIGVRSLDGRAQILSGLAPEAQVIVHSERELHPGVAVKSSPTLNGSRQ